ncbi:MAG: hypothetical protein MI892_24990 [Desulfobacterales bacterium]|nr:hypothetical protein [Desulfobacterales bacterium]
MKQFFQLTIVLWLAGVLFLGCGSDGSSEAGKLIKKQADVTEEYIDGLEKADTADEVAKAITKYTEGMKKLIPSLQEFNKKYPEYQQGKVPEGLEKEAKRLEEISAKLPGAMMKTMSHMMDPKVQAAMEQMGKEMASIEQ